MIDWEESTKEDVRPWGSSSAIDTEDIQVDLIELWMAFAKRVEHSSENWNSVLACITIDRGQVSLEPSRGGSISHIGRGCTVIFEHLARRLNEIDTEEEFDEECSRRAEVMSASLRQAWHEVCDRDVVAHLIKGAWRCVVIGEPDEEPLMEFLLDRKNGLDTD